MKTTPNHLIHIGCPIPFDEEKFLEELAVLVEACYENREDSIREMVADIVPTYHPAGVNGCTLKGDAYEELMKEVAAAQE